MQDIKKFLVTGAYGFIGSNFINYIDGKVNAEIYIVDKKGYASNPNNLKKQYETIDVKLFEFDLADSYGTGIFFHNFNSHTKFDAIFHFAAESHVDNSISGPLVFTQSNIVGTHNLIEEWRKTGAYGRFIHVSTDEVYGHLHENDQPFTELTPIQSRSPYSASKASSDLIVKSYNDTYGVDTIITRCSNNYGPKQHYEKLIPKTITNILNGKSVPVYGSGKNVREWIHVVDHVEAIWTLYNEGESGNVYNIGSGEEMTNIDVITTICKHMNVLPENTIKFVEDRKGHDFRYAIDSTKIKSSTTWYPKYEFNKSIQETIDWYRQNTPQI